MIYSFLSTDTGAPTLAGTAGYLINVLRAIFVDGYNSQGVTSISRTGSVATVVKVGHGFRDGMIVRNAGWDQTEYNIDAKITRIDADSYSYTVSGTPTTPGTGTGTAKVAPLGWAEYANPGTNVTAWQMPAGTNQFWLAVDDTGTTTARFRGYETLTANPLVTGLADALGTGPFPTTAQQSGGCYINKSDGANTTAQEWVCFSNGNMFHFLARPGLASTNRSPISFGGFTSYKATLDSYAVICCGDTTSLGAQGWVPTSVNPTTTAGLFFARSYTGAGGSVGGAKPLMYSAAGAGIQAFGLGAPFTYPATIAGGMYVQRVLMTETSSNTLDFRGHMPGLWAPWHQRPLTPGDTFSGAVGSTIAGRSFYVAAGPSNGQVFFETTEWD